MSDEYCCDHPPTEGCFRCCRWCDEHDPHRCGSCEAPLEHSDCGNGRFGFCDECQPLMQARP